MSILLLLMDNFNLHSVVLLCPPLSLPENGNVSVIGDGVGSIAMYICNSGYEPVGNTTLTCGSDGTWNVQEPVCRGKQKL